MLTKRNVLSKFLWPDGMGRQGGRDGVGRGCWCSGFLFAVAATDTDSVRTVPLTTCLPLLVSTCTYGIISLVGHPTTDLTNND